MQRYKRYLPHLALALLLVGLGVILYPKAGQYLFQRRAMQTIAVYEQQLEPQAEYGALYAMLTAYNREIAESGQAELSDMEAYESFPFSLLDYGFDSEMIGYLSIPQIDVALPVYLGASQENMKIGAALMGQTSVPIGGENTNAVITAHRGMTTAAMFRDVDYLEIGDQITYTSLWETMTYQVAEIKIISPTEVSEVLIQPGRELITLLSCHPRGDNYQRYLVYCERVPEGEVLQPRG